MSLNLYILEGHTPVVIGNLYEWACLFKGADGRVARTAHGGVIVSTVFLGLDHNWGDGPPLLFETMVFGGEHDEEQERYATWDEAVAGHEAMCLRVWPVGVAR